MTPLVSIIIPVYNRFEFIIETLESIKSQTYSNWECIIVDDGSTDKTLVVVAEYIKTDRRLKLFTRPDNYLSGGNGARNFGFMQSSGKYISFLDSDDTISIHKIKNQVQKMVLSDADLCLSDWKFFNKSGIINQENPLLNNKFDTGRDVLNLYSKYNFFIQTGVFLLKRDLILRSGLFFEALRVNQDGEFFFRILLNSSKVVISETDSLYWRMDTGNKSSYEISELKFRHRIESWKLIDSYIKIYGIENIEAIVENAKEYMFISYSKKAYHLILENKLFFKNQMKEYKKNNSILTVFKTKLLALFQ